MPPTRRTFIAMNSTKPKVVSRNSGQLQAAIDNELAGNRNPSPEDNLQAIERAYTKYGERILDPLNPGDMLVRAMVLAEGKPKI